MHLICSADSIGFLEGIFIAPDAETTGEKGSELHLSQRVCVAGSSPKWQIRLFIIISKLKTDKSLPQKSRKTLPTRGVHQKVWPWGGSGNFAETVWPWMRLALGVSFKSRPRNHANRLTKVTLLDTMRKVRGCWMLPSFRNQPRIFHTSLKWWKKNTLGFQNHRFLENSWKLQENLWFMHQSRFDSTLFWVSYWVWFDRIMDASSPESQIWDSIEWHECRFFMLCIIKHRDSNVEIAGSNLSKTQTEKLSETLFWSIWA